VTTMPRSPTLPLGACALLMAVASAAAAPRLVGSLGPEQAARKRALVEGHPMYGKELRCEDLGDLWAEVSSPRARSLPMQWSVAYLIQGEEDVTEKELAMWSNHSDTFLLTYRTRRHDAIYCPDLRMRPDDKGAFSRGRNTLFLAAQLQELRRGWAYTYFVFSDADAVAHGSWPVALPDWERFLKEWEPAIGAPLFFKEDLPFLYTHLFNREHRADPKHPRSIYWHDQMFMAVHREAARVVLPMDSSLDTRDHMISQWKMLSEASLLWRGHVLLHMGMQVVNPAHGRPEDDEGLESQCKNVSATLRSQVPPKLQRCVLDLWSGFGLTFSTSGFQARRLGGSVGPNFRLVEDEADMRPGEAGFVWLHSYYPWGTPAKKRWDYSTATLATSPNCDDEPEARGYWWGTTCHGPPGRDIASWLACARFNFMGAVLTGTE